MNIEIDKLIKHKLSIEAYLILHCLHSNNGEYLNTYARNVKKIDTSVFKDLIQNQWLTTTSENDKFTLLNIKLTDRFEKEFFTPTDPNSLSFDKAFEQLKDAYPAEAGRSGRRLKGDLTRCKRLYNSVIVKNNKVDEELHKFILQCLNFEKKFRTNKGNLEYFKMFSTWLNQKEWELYRADVEKQMKENGSISDTTNGFTTDI